MRLNTVVLIYKLYHMLVYRSKRSMREFEKADWASPDYRVDRENASVAYKYGNFGNITGCLQMIE